MPEGDTVWNTARVLERALVGDVLTGSDFRVPQLATADLTGWTVASSGSRGKHLLLRRRTAATEQLTLHSHLRMDGAWRAYRPGERWTGRPAHLIRVVLKTARSVAVGYHLHELALIPTAEEDGATSSTSGPDLLGADWDAAEAVRRIAGEAGREHRRGPAGPAQSGRGGQPLQGRDAVPAAGCGRGRRSREVPDLGARSSWRRSWWRRTRAGGPRPRPARCGAERPVMCTGGARSRAADAARRSRRRTRTSGSPTGARAASPRSRRDQAAGCHGGRCRGAVLAQLGQAVGHPRSRSVASISRKKLGCRSSAIG